MPCVPITRNAIYKLLQEQGPITAAEIADALEFTRRRVDSSIITSRKEYGTEHFRIAGYKRQVGIQGHEAAIFAAGPGYDVRRPKMNTQNDRRKIQERYREKYRHILRMRNQKKRHGTLNPFLLILGRTA